MGGGGDDGMMFPRCTALANALHSSSSSVPSHHSSTSPSDNNNPFYLAAVSILFLFRNLSSSSSSVVHPPPNLSLRPIPSGKMRGVGGGARTSSSPAASASGAARTPPTTGTTRALAFSSPESLSDWLRPRLPSDSFASWGVKPGTKTVHNLWLELSLGETSLLHHQQHLQPHDDEGDDDHDDDEKSPEPSLLRTVHVASVRIRNASGGILLETHQLLSDGTVRARRRPLSEKMKPGESVEDAAVRAVREELGVGEVRIVPGTYETRVEERTSASYPGLPVRYVLHSVDAEVEGLPQDDGEFSTEEVGECFEATGEVSEKAVFVRRHFWKWVYDVDW